jgi:hypothetical protein
MLFVRHLLLLDFRPYVFNVPEYVWICCYNRCHGMTIICDKGFWSLWGVVTVAMVTLLNEVQYVQL